VPVINKAAEYKARAEIRLGEILAASVKHEGGRPNKRSQDGDRYLLPPEVTKNLSSHAQRMAASARLLLVWELTQ